MIKLFVLLIIFSFPFNYCQISINPVNPNGNKDSVFNNSQSYDENNYFVFGFLSMNINYPKQLNIEKINQSGIMIGLRKNKTNIDEISISDAIGLHFNLGSENSIGFASSTNNIKYLNNEVDTVKHLSGYLNLLSYNINAELVFKLPVLERKIIGGVALTFLNIGGTFTYLQGGRYDKKVFGAIDFIPMYLQLYGKFSLKNATFGLGMFLNPHNFLEYRFGPKDFDKKDFGLITNSAQFSKYILMFYVYFN